MIDKIKFYSEVIGSFVLTFAAGILERLELETLQKIFYLLSILLLLIAMVKILRNKKNGPVEKFVKAASVSDQALDPEAKARLVVSLLFKIQRGGLKVMNYLKTLSKTQWISFVATIVLLLLGILSSWVPGLAIVGEHLVELFTLLGVVVAPGIFSTGKKLGEAAKEKKNLLASISELKKSAKEYAKELANLDKDNAYLKPFVDRVQKFGGKLSAEHQLALETYNQQKTAINQKIGEVELKLSAEKQKLSGGSTNESTS